MTITPIGFCAVAFAGETSCFLVEAEGESVLIDAGTNPSASLTQYGRSTIDLAAVYLSHVHADHMQGFPSLVFTRSVQTRTAGRDVGPLTVAAAPPVLEAAQQLLHLLYPEREFPIQWVPLDGVSAGVGPLSLDAFAVDHAVPSFGLTISSAGRKIVTYTSDTAFCEALVQHASGTETLIVECFGLDDDFGEMAKTAKHMCSSDAARLAGIVQPKVAIPYHMHAPYRNAAKREALMRDLATRYSGRWAYPVEGEPIDG